MTLALEHLWPALSLSWRSIVGTLLGFLGAALGSAGGVGGGSIFVPTAHLIIGFDTKSSTALSKCMIMGATLATFGYNLRLMHPYERHSPLVDYEMALLLQPMLLLGISVGVIFNTVFPTWILTLVLICVMIGTGFRTSIKAMQLWKKETMQKMELENHLTTSDVEAEPTDDCQANNDTAILSLLDEGKYSIADTFKRNIKWGNVTVLLIVWILFSILQILQSHSESCSTQYWILNALQIPVAVVAFSRAAIRIHRKNARNDEEESLIEEKESVASVSLGLLLLIAGGSLIGGMIAGLVGLGGGFALAPLLLEVGAHPQVISATATFCMLFSSSMSVLEYYLLGRFPIPYALYLLAVSILGGFSGQYGINLLIKLLGRASVIIFLMTFLTICSAAILGGLGIQDAIHQLQEGEYMGFVQLCS